MALTGEAPIDQEARGPAERRRIPRFTCLSMEWPLIVLS